MEGQNLREDGEGREDGVGTRMEAGPGLLTFLPLLPARLKGGCGEPCQACHRAGELHGQAAGGEGLPVSPSTADLRNEATTEKEAAAAAMQECHHHHHHRAGR